MGLGLLEKEDRSPHKKVPSNTLHVAMTNKEGRGDYHTFNSQMDKSCTNSTILVYLII